MSTVIDYFAARRAFNPGPTSLWTRTEKLPDETRILAVEPGRPYRCKTDVYLDGALLRARSPAIAVFTVARPSGLPTFGTSHSEGVFGREQAVDRHTGLSKAAPK